MLLSFQKPVIAAALRHIRLKKKIKWNELEIHPPLVVNASVSSGKSIMISELAAAVQESARLKGNRTKVLVIQRQGELCDQNSEAAWSIGLQNSCYSASLNRKSTHYDVIFGTEGTVARALDKEFAEWAPDMILIDENHQVGYDDVESQFMRILTHFYLKKPHLRVVGFTGSPFRNTETILGDYWSAFAKMEPAEEGYPEGGIGNGEISTEFMIQQGWVVEPHFGWPEHEGEDSYDFSQLQTLNGSWEFSEAELDAATGDLEKLQRICAEIVHRTAESMGVLIFGATHKHLAQIEAALIRCGIPLEQIGSITEKTGDKERKRILDAAKAGTGCKYVLNVGVLTTGVNVPRWDSVVFLRPIGSLVLLIQSIGRVLRLLLDEDGPGMVEMDSMTTEERLALIAASRKPFATVYDYGGVMDRLGNMYENPILEKAQKEHATRKNELIDCPVCATQNSIYARRCVGTDHNGMRCEHFWQSKICPDCGTKNDIVARSCRSCSRMLADPNEKLQHKAYTDAEMTPVLSMKMEAGANGKLIVRYVLSDGREPYQIFYPNAGNNPQVNNRIFYGNFVKHHVNGSTWQQKVRGMKAPTIVKMSAIFNVPTHISARQNEKGNFNIGRRAFRDSGVKEVEQEEVAADA